MALSGGGEVQMKMSADGGRMTDKGPGRTDWHVHIGAFADAYYRAEDVFGALRAAGTTEVWFSSTTSGFGLQIGGKPAGAGAVYRYIRGEMHDALAAAERTGMKVHALYWVMPEVHCAPDAPVRLARAMEELPYEGFKLHPSGNAWDWDDPAVERLADEVFAFAGERGMRVVVHCGPDHSERPAVFERFVARHPGATVQLAHCRPLKETCQMLRKHPNTVCDTAFAAKATQVAIRAFGLGNRMVHGTDFPATHWYANRENPPTGTVPAMDLAEFALRTGGGGWEEE